MKVLAFLLYSSIIASNQFVECAECPDVAPCKCYPTSQQIVCDDPDLDDAKFPDLNSKITGVWQYLYIHGTKITEIKANAFSKADFVNIFIVSNAHLTKIDQSAFKESTATTKLIIRENIALDDNKDLFAIVKKLGTNLKIVELDKNAITGITLNAFNDGEKKLYQLLEYIRLDNQQGPTKLTSIGAGTFANLPKLRQLSLDNNKINTIVGLGIDLSQSTLEANDHIGLFLSDNLLTETSLTATQIKLPTKASVGLVLNNNKIEHLPTAFVDLVSTVAHREGSKVYLKSNTILDCKCELVTKITEILNAKIAPLKDTIHGLISSCKKGADPNITTTTIDKC